MKNVIKQISVWICAFFIVSASFFLGFTCSLMSYEYYKESNIASASIVEEDYNVSSNDSERFIFQGSNISFYRYINNTWRTFLAQITLTQDDSTTWVFDLDLSMFGDTVMYKYGLSSTGYERLSFVFSSAFNNMWIFGNANSGRNFYAYNVTNNQRNSGADIVARAWYYKNSTTPLGTIVGFDYGMYGISGSSNPTWYLIDGTNTCISYFDSNGNRVCFAIGINTNNFISYTYLTPRTYSFINNGSDGYQFGYDDGYYKGLEEGKNDGFNTGYYYGKIDGHYEGYNEGVESANSYTFLGLFGAIIDAPVKAFSSLFDYELLGFNIKSFLMALLTCSVVIWLIKVVTGKAGG